MSKFDHDHSIWRCVVQVVWAYTDLFLLYLLVRFSNSKGKSVRLRSTNLGTYVHNDELASEEINLVIKERSERETKRVEDE